MSGFIFTESAVTGGSHKAGKDFPATPTPAHHPRFSFPARPAGPTAIIERK